MWLPSYCALGLGFTLDLLHKLLAITGREVLTTFISLDYSFYIIMLPILHRWVSAPTVVHVK